jgi:ferritin-like metal-binding protein YciE
MSDKILTSVARKRSFPKASSNITKHLKEMEDAINDLEEQPVNLINSFGAWV